MVINYYILDAGCNFNLHGRERLKQYFDMLSPDLPILSFINDYQDTLF